MSLFPGRRLLVVAPHADDEVLGCGGTMLRAVAEGMETYSMIVSVGDLRRVGEGDAVVRGSARCQEVEEVSRFLGVRGHEVLMTDEHRHLRLDSVPRRDLVALIESDAQLSVRRLRPDVVLLPAPSYNQDHEAVARAGLVACRPHDPEATHVPAVVLLYEYPPNSWSLPQERFQPQLYVDISLQLPDKLAAYSRYPSQSRTGLHQNSPENVENLALLRGREAGLLAAEAYQVLRYRI